MEVEVEYQKFYSEEEFLTQKEKPKKFQEIIKSIYEEGSVDKSAQSIVSSNNISLSMSASIVVILIVL